MSMAGALRPVELKQRSSAFPPATLAASLGLSAMFADDHAMLKWGMFVYDSLHARCREAHGWYPNKLRAQDIA